MFSSENKRFLVFLGLSACLTFAVIRGSNSSKKTKKKKEEMPQSKGIKFEKKKADIGAIFGMDVGGTLCKLIYFEKHKPPTMSWDEEHTLPDADVHGRHHSQFRTRTASKEFLDELKAGKGDGSMETPEKSTGLKKSWSMVNLETAHEHEALEQFYHFMAQAESEVDDLKREEDLVFYSPQAGGRLHFLKFETRNMGRAIDLIFANGLHNNVRQFGCTGGGAHKFASEFLEKLDVQMVKYDEMDCLVRGLQFVVNSVVSEFFTYHSSPDNGLTLQRVDSDLETEFFLDTSRHSEENEGNEEESKEKQTRKMMRQRQNTKLLGKKMQRDYRHKIHRPNTVLEKYPYLVVSIGTGVSILKVDGPNQYERVSGSSIGGGTFYGLSRLLTKCKNYDEVLNLSRDGDSRAVDMLVGDIYGSGYDRFELSSDTVASSFGKLVMAENPREESSTSSEADFAKGLLIMVTMNIGQIAYLNAQIAKTRRICFIGTFLRNNEISCQRLAYAIDYWSGGKMEALFMKHEGYLGSLGAFLQQQSWAQDTFESTKSEKPQIPYRITRSFSETSSYDRIFQQLPKHVKDKIESLRKSSRSGQDVLRILEKNQTQETQEPGANTQEAELWDGHQEIPFPS